MTPRNEALARGAMFFTGNVCKHHPQLSGKRRAKSGGCPACILERAHSRRKKIGQDEINRRNRERVAAIRAGVHVPRKYRRANEKATQLGEN